MKDEKTAIHRLKLGFFDVRLLCVQEFGKERQKKYLQKDWSTCKR